MGLSESSDSSITSKYYEKKPSLLRKIQTKSKPCLIVTPFANCPEGSTPCNTPAHIAAEILKSFLIQKKWEVSYFRGTTDPIVLDLDRPNAKTTTEFRKNITNTYMKYLNLPLWVWDIHSYPTERFARHASECTLVLPDNNEKAKKLTYKLRDRLLSQKINVNIAGSSGMNDITAEASLMKFENVFILELDETFHEDRVMIIMDQIVKFMESTR